MFKIKKIIMRLKIVRGTSRILETIMVKIDRCLKSFLPNII